MSHHFLANYETCHDLKIGSCLKLFSKLYIKKSKLIVSQKGNHTKTFWALYRVSSDIKQTPVSDNWKFKATTCCSAIIGKDNKDPFTETIYLNSSNLTNFLFDKPTILEYRERVKSSLANKKMAPLTKEEYEQYKIIHLRVRPRKRKG